MPDIFFQLDTPCLINSLLWVCVFEKNFTLISKSLNFKFGTLTLLGLSQSLWFWWRTCLRNHFNELNFIWENLGLDVKGEIDERLWFLSNSFKSCSFIFEMLLFNDIKDSISELLCLFIPNLRSVIIVWK